MRERERDEGARARTSARTRGGTASSKTSQQLTLWLARDAVEIRVEHAAHLVNLLRLLVVERAQPLQVLLLHDPHMFQSVFLLLSVRVPLPLECSRLRLERLPLLLHLSLELELLLVHQSVRCLLDPLKLLVRRPLLLVEAVLQLSLVPPQLDDLFPTDFHPLRIALEVELERLDGRLFLHQLDTQGVVGRAGSGGVGWGRVGSGRVGPG